MYPASYKINSVFLIEVTIFFLEGVNNCVNLTLGNFHFKSSSVINADFLSLNKINPKIELTVQ